MNARGLEHGAGPGARPWRPRRRTSLFAHGEPLVWLTGGALCVALLMILGLLGLVLAEGASTFWPRPLERVELADGRHVLGEVAGTEPAPDGAGQRLLVRTGNVELTGAHARWIEPGDVRGRSRPRWAVLLERTDWGRFHGEPAAYLVDGAPVAEGAEAAWRAFRAAHGDVRARWAEARDLEDGAVADVHDRQEDNRLGLRAVALERGAGSAGYRAAQVGHDARAAVLQTEYDGLRARIAALDAEADRHVLRLTTADGRVVDVAVADIVRAVPANQLGLAGRLGVYLSRWWEFLSQGPRSGATEGGVWPALFGTVLMTLLMTVFVVPLGVLAALYLREYARQGLLVSVVRVAVNNLAGVPSIVFGVFGLGMFCYAIGGWIDERFFVERLPAPTFGTGGILWASLTLALLTLPVVIVATEEALASVSNSLREGSYACGASQWQTIRRIVLPRAMPGIMTGVILAIARGAGEVAPLMLVGAARLAPDMPLDGEFPYLHLERGFMHLGVQIYDVGFKSQDGEAARPMVFTMTLLLIALVVVLDVVVLALRARLRRRYAEGRV